MFKMDPQKRKETIVGPAIVATANGMRALDAPVRYPLVLKNFTLSTSDPLVAPRSAFIVLVEHIMGTILMTLFLFSRKAQHRLVEQLRSFERKEWISVILVSLGSGLGLYFFMLSLALGNPTIAILLQKSQPLITLAFAMLIMKERPSKLYYATFFVSIFGIYFMVFESFGAGSSNEIMAALFSLIAALFWGSNTVWGRILTEKVDYWNLTTLRYIGGSISLIFFNLITLSYTSENFAILQENIMTFGTAWAPVNLSIEISGFIAILFATIVTGGIIPLTLYYFGLRWSKASVGGLAELAFPILAIFINYIFLGFGLTNSQIFGAIILFSVVSAMSFINAKEYEKDESDRSVQDG